MGTLGKSADVGEYHVTIDHMNDSMSEDDMVFIYICYHFDRFPIDDYLNTTLALMRQARCCPVLGDPTLRFQKC